MRWAVLIAAGALLTACPERRLPEPPPSGEVRSADGGASGFVHGFDRTRFNVGAGAEQISEHNLLKRSGALGTVAINLGNGAEAGVSHGSRIADEDRRRAPPPPPDRHDRLVLDYFTGAGLPRAQVQGVDTLTLLAEDGETRSPARGRTIVVGYVSALRRTVDGIALPDSVAWAQINDRGEVIQEAVFWPPIPRAVMNEAARLRLMMQDPAARAGLLGRFGPAAIETRVAIHHSLPTQAGEVNMIATLDVAVPQGPLPSPRGAQRSRPRLIERHLDGRGAEVRLPSERQPAVAETARR